MYIYSDTYYAFAQLPDTDTCVANAVSHAHECACTSKSNSGECSMLHTGRYVSGRGMAYICILRIAQRKQSARTRITPNAVSSPELWAEL